MNRQIYERDITKMNGIEKFELPEDSVILGVFENRKGTPALIICKNADPNPEVEKQEVEILCIHAGEPFTDNYGDDVSLQYLGTARCDNGYRLYHIFGLERQLEFDTQEMLNELGITDADIIDGTDLEEDEVFDVDPADLEDTIEPTIINDDREPTE